MNKHNLQFHDEPIYVLTKNALDQMRNRNFFSTRSCSTTLQIKYA